MEQQRFFPFSFLKKRRLIVTHNGNFHADDVFACATLFLYEDGHVRVLRTRDKSQIEQADYVVDVGGCYNFDQNRFDHHQPGGAGIRPNGIPYSSFGLVWKKFGPLLTGRHDASNEIDRILVQGIDAVDCGVDLADPRFEGVREMGVSDVITYFRPLNPRKEKDYGYGFLLAMDFAKGLLEKIIKDSVYKKIMGDKVSQIFATRPDPDIAVLDSSLPWEEAAIRDPKLLFVVYPRQGQWRAKSVRKNLHSFQARCLFPEEWAGLRGEGLVRASGVDGAVFCHNARFMVVAQEKKDAFLLAKKAVENCRLEKDSVLDQ